MEIKLKPIGVVHSPFQEPKDINPIRNVRPGGFDDVVGELEIFKPYRAGLKDIDGFSHLIVIFSFHRSQAVKLRVKPPFQTRLRGVFSTRSPHRPNPIGMTAVKVLGRRGGTLRVSGVDMVEGTPILDIKPYTSKDIKRGIKKGWMSRGKYLQLCDVQDGQRRPPSAPGPRGTSPVGSPRRRSRRVPPPLQGL